MLQALGGVIALDILRVLRGWLSFAGYAGHLGDVLFALYVGVVQLCIASILFSAELLCVFCIGCRSISHGWLHRVFMKVHSKSGRTRLKLRNN